MSDKLTVRHPGWLTDQEADEISPNYMLAVSLFDKVIDRARLAGASETDIANALFNALFKLSAAMDPTDEQIQDLGRMFIEGITKIRDRDPEALQTKYHG